MCLSDTAEYWQDVKRNYPYTGTNFYHIPNVDCGHRHMFTAKLLGDVNCYSCLKLIKEGYIHNLREGITISKAEKKRLAYIKSQETLYGRCSCGGLRMKRRNNKSQQEFLGCNNYPKCKITINL